MANATYEVGVDWFKLVEEGKGLITVSVTKVLAAASDYAVEDVLSENAGTGTAWTFSNVVKANGCTGYIVKAQAICETTALTPRLTLYLFTATPTCQLNDNAANTALLHADLANYIGSIDFQAMEDIGTGDSETLATPSTVGNLPLAFTCASSANDLYGVLVTRDAITGEQATMDMTIVLTIEQSYEGENITSDVKAIRFSRGKDDEQGKVQVGNLIVTLNNADGKYSPEKSGGDYYGYLLPKRAIRVRGSYNNYIYDLFCGYVEEIAPHPHWMEQDCVITAMDGMDFLARADVDTILYKSERTGALVGYIADACEWSPIPIIADYGQDTVPYGYWSNITAKTALGDVEDAELGFIYINGQGYLVFEDRHHRFTATHQTSQATFSDTMISLPYNYNPKRVYNNIAVTITPWELQSITELWRLQETPSIPSGETLTWWGDASVGGESVFVDEWTTPVATTDYTANSQSDGGGDNETTNISITTTKFAKTIKLEINNNAGHLVYITLLKARGTYYDDLTKVTRRASDSTSQTNYQKRTLQVEGKYLTSADVAQDYANFAVSRYKDPQAEVAMEILNRDATLLEQILSRDISDRITVINTKLGMSKDFFIDWMEHKIEISGLLHKVTYRLADASNEDFWCLDYSAFPSALGVGGQTKLGY